MNLIECRFGRHYDGGVLLDGAPLSPARSQRVFNHSPDGFSWGYGGSGPAQLALAILLEVTNDEDLSVRLHQDFKFDFVARWPQDTTTQRVDVAGWVRERTLAGSRP